MAKYTIVGGKHSVVAKDGTRITYKPGDVIELSAEDVAKFPDRFRLVEEPKPEPKAAATGPAPVQPQPAKK